jgi:hypothetical protein
MCGGARGGGGGMFLRFGLHRGEEKKRMREGTSWRHRGNHVSYRGPVGGPSSAYGLPIGEEGLSLVGHYTSPFLSIPSNGID